MRAAKTASPDVTSCHLLPAGSPQTLAQNVMPQNEKGKSIKTVLAPLISDSTLSESSDGAKDRKIKQQRLLPRLWFFNGLLSDLLVGVVGPVGWAG